MFFGSLLGQQETQQQVERHQPLPQSIQPLQQQQQQHPFLAAVYGDNYDYSKDNQQRAGHFGYYHHQSPFRPLAGADSNVDGVYSSSAHSGYGTAPSDGYEYPPMASHPASGTGYGVPVHPAHPHPPAHPPPPPIISPPSSSSKMKKWFGGNSAVSSLTLLSFFFFVNLLQNCIKDQMEAMNPTVMVMTAGVRRNGFNKLAEMNSREHGSTSPASVGVTEANVVIKPEELLSPAAVVTTSSSLSADSIAGVSISIDPTVRVQVAYGGSNGITSNQNRPSTSHNNNHHNNNNNNNNNDDYNNYNYQQQQQEHQQQQQQDPQSDVFSTNFNNFHNHADSNPEFSNSAHFYPNRTFNSPPFNDKRHNYQQQQEQQHYQDHLAQQEEQQQQQPSQHFDFHNHNSDHRRYPAHSSSQQYNSNSNSQSHIHEKYPWSYGPASSSSISSMPFPFRRGNTHSSSSSSSWPMHISGNNYFNDDDDYDARNRYGDSFYTRSN